MNLPTIEPIPSEEKPAESAPLTPARRRHARRAILPQGAGERAAFLYELSLRFVPSFDFYLMTLLSGLVMAVALVIDSFPLLFLAALLAPFMAPAVGAALGAVSGTARYWLQSLGSLFVGCLIVLLAGLLGGWVAAFLPVQMSFLMARQVVSFTWGGFMLLTLGAALLTYQVVRSPQQKPLVSSVAIAYSLYSPMSAVGFGIVSHDPTLIYGGLVLFVLYLIWALLISTLVFALLGLRPLTSLGYVLGACYSLAGILAIAFIQLGSVEPLSQAISTQVDTLLGQPTQVLPAYVVQPTPSATPPREKTTAAPTLTLAATETPLPSDTPLPPTGTATSTPTLIPTGTPTLTLTPQPTPIWAKVKPNDTNGIIIRSSPGFADDNVIQSLYNDSLVIILPEPPQTVNGVLWVKIRTVNTVKVVEGWVVAEAIATATPATGH